MRPDAAFHIVARSALYEHHFLRFEALEVSTPAGSVHRVAVRHPGAVAVIAVDGGEVILLEQYRPAVDRHLLELPAGKLDVDGEPPDMTAARELEEEIGFRPGRLEHLFDFFTAPGFSDEHMRLFLATELTAVPASPHGPEEEAAVTVPVPLGEIPALLASGDVVDAKSIIGLQWLELHPPR